MTPHHPHPLPARPNRVALRPASFCVAVLLALVVAGAPASAQYGGGPSLLVDPVRVPIDADFDAFGTSCPAGATVTITIDGISGGLATTTAADDSFFTVDDVDMPAGVIAGTDYVVRAMCGGQSATFVITAVCNDGRDPVDGACRSGSTVGGGDPGATTTTAGGGSSTTTPASTPTDGDAGGGGGGGSGDGGSTATTVPRPDLAVTGAGIVEQLLTVGATLVAAGFFLMLWTARRRDAPVSAGVDASASPAPR